MIVMLFLQIVIKTNLYNIFASLHRGLLLLLTILQYTSRYLYFDCWCWCDWFWCWFWCWCWYVPHLLPLLQFLVHLVQVHLVQVHLVQVHLVQVHRSMFRINGSILNSGTSRIHYMVMMILLYSCIRCRSIRWYIMLEFRSYSILPFVVVVFEQRGSAIMYVTLIGRSLIY